MADSESNQHTSGLTMLLSNESFETVQTLPQHWPDWLPVHKDEATNDSPFPGDYLRIRVLMSLSATLKQMYDKYWATGSKHYKNLFVVRELGVPPLASPKK